MKKSLSVLFCLIALNGFSQKKKISIEKDTLMVDGAPYCLAMKKNVGFGASDISIKNLQGLELIFLKFESRNVEKTQYNVSGIETWHTFNFIQSGAKVEIHDKTEKATIKMVAENELIKNGQLDADAVKRFVMLNNGWYPDNGQNNNPTTPPIIVNINNGGTGSGTNNSNNNPAPKSKSPVTLQGKQIMQDGEIIGKFRQDTTSSNYSQKTIVVTIYSGAGEKVAEATVPLANPQEWNIKTFADNKTTNIMYDSPGEKENLFKWLADKSYLGK